LPVSLIFYIVYGSSITIAGELTWALKKSGNIESALNAFFATGNISSASGLGLLQDKGTVPIFLKHQLFCSGSVGVVTPQKKIFLLLIALA
jgi:hypothetical protein